MVLHDRRRATIPAIRYSEDGIDPEAAYEWATETARYPRRPADILAARRYLDRANRKDHHD